MVEHNNESNNTTSSESKRYIYTNDVLSGVTVITANALMIYSVVTGTSIPGSLIASYIMVLLASGGWLFGADLIEKYKRK